MDIAANARSAPTATAIVCLRTKKYGPAGADDVGSRPCSDDAL